ncbi:MAG: 3-hydroxybutyryl-CoA dehydratase [Gammaproteobacteria bacterium]|nr:3-hydroxybutyryl-CoA dehydratase [Gammaproteobacteria bacterium]
MTILTNVPAGTIKVGDRTSYTKTCTFGDIQLFAKVSGDVNPVHLDEEFASETQFGQRIAHGMYTAGLVSAAVGLQLPGPGTIYLSQDIKFSAPVFVDDTITVELEVVSVREDKPIVGLEFVCKNQKDKVVASGKAVVLAPSEALSLEAPELPDINIG